MNTRDQVRSRDEKLKIVIRIRPVLNGEDPAQFVSLEGVATITLRTKPLRFADLAIILT